MSILVRPSWVGISGWGEGLCRDVRTCASSCRRRGDADASTTRSLRNVFNAARFSRVGGPGGLRGPGAPEDGFFSEMGAPGSSVYGGGGSDGRSRSFDMVAIRVSAVSN